ncbi:hypothetical protein GCM10025859_43330 [Alicyclobacillus fastidiosus]|nr:hypothetical protein GCM10025859_43330 [Alicyclobacillus fastidiosus]
MRKALSTMRIKSADDSAIKRYICSFWRKVVSALFRFVISTQDAMTSFTLPCSIIGLSEAKYHTPLRHPSYDVTCPCHASS